jgi:hypothetical protein
MKITVDKLRQIIIEEVIKEELAPEIAAPAIAAMLQGMEAETTSDVFGAAFDQLYGEGALEGEAERQAAMEEPEEEEFPTGYQAGGAYGDRPQVGFKESIEDIIKEELDGVLGEGHGGEGSMARKQLGRTAELAMMIQDMVMEESDLEEWVESKITKAQDYLTAVLNYMRGDQLSEDMATRDDIGALRQQIGDMSYEIERMLVALMKAGYSMEDIMQMASELKRMDPHPADVQVAERKLSKSEKKKKEKVVKGMKKSKKDFEKRYGDDAESVMYATATKMAKKKKE